MSRFKPSGTRQALQLPALSSTPAAEIRSTSAPASETLDSSNPRAPYGDRPTLFQSIGFYVLLLYLVSGTLNDWTMRLAGGKAYLSSFTLVALPFVFLMSGGALNGLKNRIGKYWLFFLMFMLLSTPLSVWRGGSVTFLMNYVPRAYILLYYICAFVVSLRQIRIMFMTLVLTNVLLLFSCMKFGTSGDVERFYIPGSMFYANANDLALALVLAITYFMYVLRTGMVLTRVAAGVCILISTLYLLKTGSRGCTLALLFLFATIVWASKKRMLVIALAAPFVLLATILAPSASLHRIMLFTFNSSTVGAKDTEDLSALGSQVQRQQLFRRSVRMTLTHPLLGVGPNMFAVADSGEYAKKGQWAVWLGTHNSYTQVSSECGIPAFFCYAAVLVLSTRIVFRLYRRTRDSVDPQQRQIAALAFSTFAGLIVYAVGTTFFHMAYTGGLPILAGTALTLQNASMTAAPARVKDRPALE